MILPEIKDKKNKKNNNKSRDRYTEILFTFFSQKNTSDIEIERTVYKNKVFFFFFPPLKFSQSFYRHILPFKMY